MTVMDTYSHDGTTVTTRDRLVFLMRGGMTKRFHNGAVLHENSVAHHSWGVAWFCYLLVGDRVGRTISSNLLLAAMAHDMAEQITSDVSAPAKRMLGIRAILHEKETQVLRKFDLDFEAFLNSDERIILSQADAMDGMLHCIRERMFGNRFMEYTFQKFLSYVRDTCTSEVSKDILNSLLVLWEDANEGAICEQQ